MKSKKEQIPLDEVIEVVMRKEMKYGDYLKLIHRQDKKGWKIQGYELKHYAPKLRKKI